MFSWWTASGIKGVGTRVRVPTLGAAESNGSCHRAPDAGTLARGRSMKYRLEPHADANGMGYYKSLPDPFMTSPERSCQIAITSACTYGRMTSAVVIK